MERAVGGYTIVEVMIVLAVTALFFTSAVYVFSSQRASTNFSQAMQDVNSKIQSYANQVVTSYYPGSDSYSCSVSGGHPSLVSGGSSGSLCLFLGLAVQAFPNQSSLQAYTVLGNKDLYNGGSDSGNPALSIDTAKPEVAYLGSNYVLTDTFNLSAGSKIISSTSSSTPYNLVGMYNGLPGDSAAGTSGSSALVLRGYNCNSFSCVSSPSVSGQLKACIEESTCPSPPTISQWKICFQDGGSSNRALVTVNSAPGGVSTQLSFVACS